MKAIVPTGGRGTRLRPITHTSAKQLVPVANEPILSYVLRDIAAAGITEVGLVVGDTATEIEAAVHDGAAWGLRATYLPQESPAGLADCVQVARDWLGDEPFLMYLGDNMLRDGVRAFVEGFDPDREAASIMVAKVPEPQRFGVVELDGDRVVRLIEKPHVPPSDLALVGAYLFTPAVHDQIARLRPSERGEYEITEAIQGMIDHGEHVSVHHVEGWWKDTGRVEDLLEANRLVLETLSPAYGGESVVDSSMEGVVVLGSGARVERSTLRGPLVIGEHTIVRDAEVGPYTSIGPACIVEDSTVRNSIVMEGCRLTGANYLTGSLLGREVVVEQISGRLTLVIGDHGHAHG